jgi:rare lipoprotein A
MILPVKEGCFLPLLLTIFLTACAPQPRIPELSKSAPPASIGAKIAGSEGIAGKPGYMSRATYYAKRFDGRLTITDERYDPSLLTAATHDLPLGTMARVINPKNGREVVVRINDRPRKRKFPLIDLSRAAAKKLGFLSKGIITVRVIPLPPDAPEYSLVGKGKKEKKSKGKKEK